MRSHSQAHLHIMFMVQPLCFHVINDLIWIVCGSSCHVYALSCVFGFMTLMLFGFMINPCYVHVCVHMCCQKYSYHDHVSLVWILDTDRTSW